jgi:transposase, IS6 family
MAPAPPLTRRHDEHSGQDPGNGTEAGSAQKAHADIAVITRRFFIRALEHGSFPTEVSTDRTAAYPRAVEELIPTACHVTEQYANNSVESDHGRLKARLRPMRGLTRLRSAWVISAGHAFVQNLRRGHYELGWDIDRRYRLTAIFVELARAI